MISAEFFIIFFVKTSPISAFPNSPANHCKTKGVESSTTRHTPLNPVFILSKPPWGIVGSQTPANHLDLQLAIMIRSISSR